MNTDVLHNRIDKHIRDAAARYKLDEQHLKHKVEIFRPDSATIPTAVSVEIGWQDKKDDYILSIHYFYSPQVYACAKDTELARQIKSYLKSKKIKPF